MAKTTVKTTKSTQKPAEMSLEQLRKELESKRNDLAEARLSHKRGELVSPRVITSTRKEIARLMTAVRAAEINEIKENK